MKKNPGGEGYIVCKSHRGVIYFSEVVYLWLPHPQVEITLWKFVAENHTEKFATLKITLKNNIKEGFTENYTEKRPLLFRNAKNG